MSGFNFSGSSALNSPQQTAGLGNAGGERMTIKDRRKAGGLGSNSRKDSGQSSILSGKAQSATLSPLNPKRLSTSGAGAGSGPASATGSFSAMSLSAPFISNMGMNGSAAGASGLATRAKSPPPQGNGRSRTILPGLKR